MASGTKNTKLSHGVQSHRLAILILIVFLLMYLISSGLLPFPPIIQYAFNRLYSSEPAHTALQVAETSNYSLIFNMAPFMDSGDDLDDPDYQNYTWISYVNNATLEYIQNRISNKMVSGRCRSITFRYLANATWFLNASFWINNENFIIRNETSGQESFWEIYHIGISVRYFVNDSFQEEYPGGYPISQQNFSMVYLSFYYSEVYGPLAAFYTGVKQIVVIDSLGQIIYVLVSNLGQLVS